MGSLIEDKGVIILSLALKQVGEQPDTRQRVRVLLGQHLLPQLQRPPMHLPGLDVLSIGLKTQASLEKQPDLSFPSSI